VSRSARCSAACTASFVRATPRPCLDRRPASNQALQLDLDLRLLLVNPSSYCHLVPRNSNNNSTCLKERKEILISNSISSSLPQPQRPPLRLQPRLQQQVSVQHRRPRLRRTIHHYQCRPRLLTLPPRPTTNTLQFHQSLLGICAISLILILLPSMSHFSSSLLSHID